MCDVVHGAMRVSSANALANLTGKAIKCAEIAIRHGRVAPGGKYRELDLIEPPV